MERQTAVVAPACPVCGSAPARESWRYKDHAILACVDCGLEFANPLRAAPLAYYQSHYGGPTAAAIAGLEAAHPVHLAVAARVAGIVERYLAPAARRAIDIGCGNGFLLSTLKASGFECVGIDFNPDVVRVAKEKFQVDARVSRLEDLGGIEPRFDIALLVHVLEHVEDPVGLLRRIRGLLNANGILFMDLPNRSRFGFNRSLTRGEHDEYQYPPHHITFWSAPTLARALRTAGYSVLECRPRPLGQEGQVSYFLENRLKVRSARVRGVIEPVLRRAGQLAGLQSEFLDAVARTG